MSKGLIRKMIKPLEGQMSFFEEEDKALAEKKQDTIRYITAGNATFTLESTKLDKRFTYKVVHKKNDNCPHRFIVSRMYGSDNESDYKFVGIYYADTGAFKTKAPTDNKPVEDRMFAAFIKMLHSPTELWYDTCKFYKSTKCAHCGRKLTTPESIERGIGPECYERVFGKGV